MTSYWIGIAWPGMAIGAGKSGHGFKFTPLIGQLLVQLALEEEPPIDINALRLHPARLRIWKEYAGDTSEPVRWRVIPVRIARVDASIP